MKPRLSPDLPASRSGPGRGCKQQPQGADGGETLHLLRQSGCANFSPAAALISQTVGLGSSEDGVRLDPSLAEDRQVFHEDPL